MIFEEKVILITGASSGMGADAARHLAKLGGKVAMVGRNQERLNAVADEIINEGSTAPLVIVADITVDAERIITETVEHFGKLDVLVNNAAIIKVQPFIESDIEQYDDLMNTNIRSVIILTQLAVPHLEKTKGNIVNVSSLAGKIVFKGATFYNLSKAALNQFSNCAAFELGPKGIRVNTINPALVETPFLKTGGLTDDQFNELEEKLGGAYPLGRVGQVSDTSAAIAYLASDAASFITGSEIQVDGGALRAGAY